jgi:hypothetical protein
MEKPKKSLWLRRKCFLTQFQFANRKNEKDMNSLLSYRDLHPLRCLIMRVERTMRVRTIRLGDANAPRFRHNDNANEQMTALS